MGKHNVRRATIIGIAAASVASALVFAAPANAEETRNAATGGWSEVDGSFTGTANGLLASPNHRGASESKVIGGTTNKRAHGWTTWAGTYHYTTARLEHYWPASGVIATSGRKWGTGGTEAASPWKAFNPNAPSNGNGIAKTYYGR